MMYHVHVLKQNLGDIVFTTCYLLIHVPFSLLSGKILYFHVFTIIYGSTSLPALAHNNARTFAYFVSYPSIDVMDFF